MHALEVGQPYPFHNHATGTERVVLQRTEAFFDVLYYSQSAATDARPWGRLPLRVGVAEPVPGTPYVLFQFPDDWEFAVTLNLHKASTAAAARDWLASRGNLVTMCLLDAQTNVVRRLRVVSLPPAVAQQLRAAAARQLAGFADAGAADAVFKQQERTLSFARLLAGASMSTAGE